MALIIRKTLAILQPKVFFITDPVLWKIRLFAKVRLCCGLNLVGTIRINDELRPEIGIQVVTAMTDMRITSPAYTWCLL